MDDSYLCKVCSGHGEVDVGWMHPIIKPCLNCEGTGECNWIRNIIPLRYNEGGTYTADAEL